MTRDDVTEASVGVVRNRNLVGQIIQFGNIRYGKMSGTNIDYFMDFYGIGFIFVEAKFGGGMPPFGQKLALQRICNACSKGGVLSAVVIAGHTCHNQDIVLAECMATHKYYEGKWTPFDPGLTVQVVIDSFKKKVDSIVAAANKIDLEKRF